jgi:hypothetical protein
LGLREFGADYYRITHIASSLIYCKFCTNELAESRKRFRCALDLGSVSTIEAAFIQLKKSHFGVFL